VNRKYSLEQLLKYVYNDGVIVDFESIRLSYLENMLEFLINLDYKVKKNLLKTNLFNYKL